MFLIDGFLLMNQISPLLHFLMLRLLVQQNFRNYLNTKSAHYIPQNTLLSYLSPLTPWRRTALAQLFPNLCGSVKFHRDFNPIILISGSTVDLDTLGYLTRGD